MARIHHLRLDDSTVKSDTFREQQRSADERDREELALLGKKQVLRRKFGFMSMLGFSCTIPATWEGLLILFIQGLANGGSAGLVYGYLLSWFGTVAIFVSMAELGSMAPTISGQYHWVAVLAPSCCGKFLSYLTGWLTVAGWQAFVASACYLCGTMIQGLIVLQHPTYTPELWHGTLLFWAVAAFGVFVNTVISRALPQIKGMFLVLPKDTMISNHDVIVSKFQASMLLDHNYLSRYPLQNISINSVTSLNTLDLCNGLVIEEATIDQLQKYMGDGKLTSVQLTACYMQRVFQVERYINPVLQLNPDSLQIAKRADTERRAGHVRGPLHGIPFLIKDNIASRDRLQTAAGSLALVGSIVPRDAYVVSRLRRAGAVLMGKSTLSEWADMRSNIYSEGYSATAGQSRSSYNLTVNPGGSSSGSAIAVANNVIPIALGTETDGSVINPAERNAVVGIKPTVGLTSRAGVVPESIHQDTVGTFGRTVRDAVYALDAIYGVDHRDNYTSAQKARTPPQGYAAFLSNKTALQGARFGLPWQSFWALADAEQQSILLDLINLITSAGATIINNTEITNYQTLVSPNGWNWDYGSTRGRANESEYTYVKVDFYNNLHAYLSELGNTTIRSVGDVVQFNNDHAYAEGASPSLNPAYESGQDGLLASLATGGEMNATYWEALSFCQTSTRTGIDDALGNLDALLVPPDVGQTYQIAAQAGYPMITIPTGVHSKSGMPFGLAAMGTAFAEAKLVKYASAIEDLQKASGEIYQRARPRWLGFRVDSIPVDSQCFGC
ncbi:MAG: hypothetical protein Q9200_003855 [Gallowayella weberi]